MRQDDFVARYQVEWDALGRWLDVRARPKRRSTATGTDVDDMEFTSRYRRVCQHLAIARRRGYSPRVQRELQSLVQRGHDVLYRPPNPRLVQWLAFFADELPRLVRRNHRFVWLSAG